MLFDHTALAGSTTTFALAHVRSGDFLRYGGFRFAGGLTNESFNGRPTATYQSK